MKRCPHCHKPISLNKELCLEGFAEFGTLKKFLEAKLDAQKRLSAGQPCEPCD